MVWPDSNDNLTGDSIHTKTTPSLVSNKRHLHANFKFIKILRQKGGGGGGKAPERIPKPRK